MPIERSSLMPKFMRSSTARFGGLIALALLAQGFLIWWSANGVGDPLGDVRYAYDPWVQSMIGSGKWLGINTAWVYPYVALAPIWLPHLISPVDYMTGWLLLVVNMNMLTVGHLLGWGKRMDRSRPALFFVGAIFLLGPVSIGRLESFTLALSVVAFVAYIDHKEHASIQWLNMATWIKVAPVAALLAAFVASRDRLRFVIYVAISVAATIAVGLALGGNANLFSFVFQQASRGIQIESPIALVWLWQIMTGVLPATPTIYYADSTLTFQIDGFGVDIVAGLMTIVQLGALAITAWLAIRAVRAGADRDRMFAWILFTATLDLIVFNKVGSPQYQMWLIAAVVYGLISGIHNWRTVSVMTLIVCLLTQLIYPAYYGEILAGHVGGILLLSLRNLLLVYLLVLANYRLTHLGNTEKSKSIFARIFG